MDKIIKVGVYGWENFPLKNGYYPTDLPQEWKLSYYANEFETACVDLSMVLLEQDLWLAMLEDLPPAFELSFALTQISQLQPLKGLIDQTALNISYLIVPAMERDILLQQISTNPVLSRIGISRPEQIVSRSSCWMPESAQAASSIALLPQVDAIRQYRQWIDQWLDKNSEQALTLWLDGSTANYSTLSELRTLVELMGY